MAIWMVIGVPLFIMALSVVLHLNGTFAEEEERWKHGYPPMPSQTAIANRLKIEARARSEWEQTLAELERKQRAERIQREYEARQAAAKGSSSVS